MEKLPKRKQIRLKNYDYSSCGYYFITICTKNRQYLFWENPDNNIVGADIIRPKLSKCGEFVDRAIKEINIHYPHIIIDEYAIMPDHVHLILKVINNDKYGRILSAPTQKPIMTVIG